MSLGDEPTRRIDHVFPSIGVVTPVDEFRRPTLGAQTQALVGQKLVGGETVVQFDHVHISYLKINSKSLTEKF